MRYKLGTIEQGDIEYIRELRNSQIDILRQFRPINSIEQEEYFSRLHKDNKQILFSILDNDNLVGYCGLTNINYVYGTTEIAFIVNGEEHEKVFLFALGELSKYAFHVLNLNKVWTETYEFRKSHIKVIKDFGMKQEGVLREHAYKKGKRFNSVIHSLLRREYESF